MTTATARCTDDEWDEDCEDVAAAELDDDDAEFAEIEATDQHALEVR
ncbi:hypothetical protein OAH18_02145 [bacterium]|nr:hypothetical protein [bacterium]